MSVNLANQVGFSKLRSPSGGGASFLHETERGTTRLERFHSHEEVKTKMGVKAQDAPTFCSLQTS